jgi:hypothetical protein
VVLVAASLWYNARYPQLTVNGRKSSVSTAPPASTSVDPQPYFSPQVSPPASARVVSDGYADSVDNHYTSDVVESYPRPASRPASLNSASSAVFHLPPPPASPPPPPTTAWAAAAPSPMGSDEFDGFNDAAASDKPDNVQEQHAADAPVKARPSWGEPVVPHKLAQARPSWDEPVVPSSWAAPTVAADANTADDKSSVSASRIESRKSSGGGSSRSSSKKSSSKRGSKRVSKLDISGPSDFRHEGHIGMNDLVSESPASRTG